MALLIALLSLTSATVRSAQRHRGMPRRAVERPVVGGVSVSDRCACGAVVTPAARADPAWQGGSARDREVALTDRAGPSPATRPAGLTARQVEIVRLMAAGQSNAEIAQGLVLSVRTVERHIENIYAKLGVHGKSARAAVATYAARTGLLAAS